MITTITTTAVVSSQQSTIFGIFIAITLILLLTTKELMVSYNLDDSHGYDVDLTKSEKMKKLTKIIDIPALSLIFNLILIVVIRVVEVV